MMRAFSTIFSGFVMSANQEFRRDAKGSSPAGALLPSDQDVGVSAQDAEQVRRDLFHEAVQQALARQAADLQRRRGRNTPVNSAEILTSSELKFLLRQDT